MTSTRYDVVVVGGGAAGLSAALVLTLAAFVAPELTATIHPLAALLGGVAEISTLGYLLVKGVRTPRPTDRPSAVASTPLPASA